MDVHSSVDLESERRMRTVARMNIELTLRWCFPSVGGVAAFPAGSPYMSTARTVVIHPIYGSHECCPFKVSRLKGLNLLERHVADEVLTCAMRTVNKVVFLSYCCSSVSV